MNPTLTLKEALFPLKESSKSAIADADCESFDEIQEYLHLNRDIERDLRVLLEAVKNSDSKKLFLVCGNVGDGKSHLLASIRLKNPELLNGITLHNDATESSEPDATFIDELTQLLAPFSSQSIAQGNEKIVLAINLGTLNNFLSSDEGNRFSELKTYVKSNKILEVGDILECQFDENSPFQFVNFCDHNLFYLTEDGPVSELIETALERVVSKDGPFYVAYENQKNTSPPNCPICFNFEALQTAFIRKKISSLLIECIIKGEITISIRALYNFIYELIIPVDLEPLDYQAAIKRIKNYKNGDFLQNIIPNYIFLHPKLSYLFKEIKKLDPASRRGESLDNAIIELTVSTSPLRIVNQYIPPGKISDNLSQILSNKNPNNNHVNTFIRAAFFWQKEDNILFQNTEYETYMSLMLGWYSGDGKTLKPLYNLVQQAAISWRGQAGTGRINVDIGRQQLEYRISEDVNIKPDPPTPPMNLAESKCKFNAFLPVKFIVGHKKFQLTVTYKLYALVCKISNGYRPTSLDHSNFVVFDDFVKNIATAGDGHKKVFFTESSNGRQFILELDDFGDFCFNEVAA